MLIYVSVTQAAPAHVPRYQEARHLQLALLGILVLHCHWCDLLCATSCFEIVPAPVMSLTVCKSSSAIKSTLRVCAALCACKQCPTMTIAKMMQVLP